MVLDLVVNPMETDSPVQKVANTLDLKSSKICAHCNTTKTSLWRNGPLGPKSMCNACGLRYQRRGMKKVELEIRDDKGKKKRRSGTKRIQNQRRGVKALTLGRKAESGKNKSKNKGSKEVELGVMTAPMNCQKESVLAQSQQHGDEVVKAAIQLMELSCATQCLIN